MSRRFFLLANPTSGRKNAGKVINEVSRFLSDKGEKYDIHLTTPDRKGTALVSEEMTDDFTDLVVIGGDGTIYEAINGIRGDQVVSFLPAGSGNDFVKNIPSGQNLDEKLHTLLHGRVRNVDLGVCNGKKFANGVGVGFDGQIVADMQHRKVPFLSGQAKYYYHVLHILASYQSRHFEYSVSGKAFSKELCLLTVAKGTTFGGGFRLTPHAQIDDGKLAICELSDLSAVKRYLNIPRFQMGTHDRMKEVSLYKTDQIRIEKNDLLEGHIDGEYLGRPPFDISVLPGALKVMIKRS